MDVISNVAITSPAIIYITSSIKLFKVHSMYTKKFDAPMYNDNIDSEP